MKKVLSFVIALCLLLTASFAMAMPTYSSDGTCDGSDCHAPGEFGTAATPVPEAAEEVEDPLLTAATEMAVIAVQAIYPDGLEEAELEAVLEVYIASFYEMLVELAANEAAAA